MAKWVECRVSVKVTIGRDATEIQVVSQSVRWVVVLEMAGLFLDFQTRNFFRVKKKRYSVRLFKHRDQSDLGKVVILVRLHKWNQDRCPVLVSQFFDFFFVSFRYSTFCFACDYTNPK